MWSYITSLFNYFFKIQEDEGREKLLKEELIDLKLELEREEFYNQNIENKVQEFPQQSECFQRTGFVTHCGDSYILIDGSIYYDTSSCSFNLNVHDKIIYLGYTNSNEELVIVRILQNEGIAWENDDDSEEQRFNVINHIIVGIVDCREDRFVYIQGGDLKFNLDSVQGSFIPIAGDWLEMLCSIQKNDEKLTDINMTQVLQVTHFHPLRTKIKSGTVTEWSGKVGSIDSQIFFNSSTFMETVIPQVGVKVMVEAIESSQGYYSWRAIKLVIIEKRISVVNDSPQVNIDEQRSLELEKSKNISITYPLKFPSIDISSSDSLNLTITNKSHKVHTLNKWMMLSRKRDSQILLKPLITQPQQLLPGESINFTVICEPKFLGSTKECLLIQFKGFQFKRYIDISVIDKFGNLNGNSDKNKKIECSQMIDKMRRIQKDNESFIPGIKTHKNPHFTASKLGSYPIPEKIWQVVLGDSVEIVYTHDFDKILNRIQAHFPCLIQDMTLQNYCDRWHTLLFMEEIQTNINLRVYDKPKAFLIRHQDYLGLEISGLCERRPSLLAGDRVIVQDTWIPNNKNYEGFIHMIKGDLVLFKFDSRFHELYDGGDVSVQFHLSRTTYRRAHHAINNVLNSLGPDILFPSKLKLKPYQVPKGQLEKINWYNNNLNNGQKRAVMNILKGESRPLPYVIFGPPGTGKTITVIETILQILKNIPDSRILVATPSNSASNLITERLIQYRNEFSGSVVRLIAHYLVDSKNISDVIKPYCATIDIAKEGTSNSKHYVKDNINLNCQKSYLGRHRVIISTCNCIGSFFYMNFPKGHFTHVIVDEAGQANEPELMIPLSLSDKNCGQIILAGDPMQLGPVILSKNCIEFGMDQSYLCRILECYPYQKDYNSYKDGFDDRVVTKLNDNYRSLEEVLLLPSKMFYDNTLVPKFDKNTSWIPKIVNATCDVFSITENKSGGIYVYGIQGQNTRAEDSPSWYNPQEASMVALTTCKLYKNKVTPEEIGIISPYIAQIKYLRLIFNAMGLPQPKIGTVEEFQGQERPIILITTVRSTESLIQQDNKYTLGFVNSPKRLNVAITRAQISMILFCNPYLLSTDLLWNEVIMNAVNNNKYMGCYFSIEEKEREK
ncbi:probable RNA helicase armi [Pieris brassicae]|uniref:probable RNA helicase armi n=1 Tax=Pieris brassicae TaxID=7116 RepID=UPI001E66191C|nr:probable RNA helicase armi [Pieris brassicae]XP_045527650.1 probable RNA helicase armi [Pieris brassicae]